MKIYRPHTVISEMQEIEVGKSFLSTFFIETLSILIVTVLIVWVSSFIVVESFAFIQEKYDISISIKRK